MKQLNHLGSAVLLAVVVMLAAILLLHSGGLVVDWKPKTMPYRLTSNPFIGWGLVAVLGAGLLLIRKRSPLAQCVAALLLVGFVWGLAAVTSLFWDAFLSPVLALAVLPVQHAAISTLRSLLEGRGSGAPL
ncbi:hypothetical protein [Acidovorax sp. 1608163]|uniref:hypothetical protein n=1 Tax=Acidovorax sp. 1608163 TaxID=2478662 RepID=UPI0013CE7947|nr:hypothetical protein [Acidovorax sp. 1608163]